MNTPRLHWTEIAPRTYQAMATVKTTFARSTLGQVLMSLVDLRVSQINGYAFCVDMHAPVPDKPLV